MREWLKSLVEQVSAWPGVSSHDHRFGGVEFRVGSREIGHVHWFGIVDIPFTVKIRDALIRARRAERHHWLPDSGWTTVRVKRHGVENALGLLRFSYLRIQAKSADAFIAAASARELESCALDPEVLEAAGAVAVPLNC
jgi:Family of unknown function (DUF5519)